MLLNKYIRIFLLSLFILRDMQDWICLSYAISLLQYNDHVYFYVSDVQYVVNTILTAI